jgi:SAM-dependent methyltransferase
MTRYSQDELRRIRRTRRAPRLTQFDYLHIRRLVDDLRTAIDRLARPGDRVLDVWCGSRPYDDLLPSGVEVTALDIEDNPYGVATVVSDTLLPYGDASFDLLLCIQSFHFMPDPQHVVRELERVLRPGGAAIVSIPFTWEYDRAGPDRRYTDEQLAALFGGWDDVTVVANGARAVAWTTLTGSIAFSLQQRAVKTPLRPVVAPLFAALYATVNVLGLILERTERHAVSGARVLPMNLLLTARRAQ